MSYIEWGWSYEGSRRENVSELYAGEGLPAFFLKKG